MSTYTQSSTYTITDVGKVVDRFASDFHMIAQATGLSSRDRVINTAHDVKLMAQRNYIDEINIVLCNSSGGVVRAHKYTVSTDASGWTCDRPGNNLWPRQIGGGLYVVVSFTTTWWVLTGQQRQAFIDDECVLHWSSSNVDTSFPGLTSSVDRRYASNAYGLERRTYGGAF
jgi:hypothetical protein